MRQATAPARRRTKPERVFEAGHRPGESRRSVLRQATAPARRRARPERLFEAGHRPREGPDKAGEAC